MTDPKKKSKPRARKTASRTPETSARSTREPQSAFPLDFALFAGGLFLILPFLFSNQTLDAALLVKQMFAAALAVFGGALALRGKPFNELRALTSSPFALAGLIFIFFSAVSLFFAINPAEGVLAVLRPALGLLLALATGLFVARQPKEMLLAARFAAVSVFAVCAVSLLQYWEIAFTEINGWDNYFPFATFSNPNFLAVWLATAAPLAVWLAFTEKNFLLKIALFGLAAFAVYIIYLARSRTALGAVGIATVVCAVLHFLPGARIVLERATRVRLKTAAALFVGMLLSSGAALWFFAEDPAGLIKPLGPNETESSVQQRLITWRTTGAMALDHPGAGVGAGNWKINAPAYQLEYSLAKKGSVLFVRAHNDWLEAGAETGLGGMAAYGLLLLTALLAPLRVFATSNDRATRAFGLALFASVLIYTLDALFNFPRERPEIAANFYFAAGAALGLLAAQQKLPQAPALPRPAALAVYGLLLAGAAGMLWAGTRHFQMEKSLRKIIAANQVNQYDYMLARFEEGVKPPATLAPNGTPVYWYKGLALYGKGDLKAAAEAFEQARRHNPYNFATLNNLASAYAGREQYEKAEQVYREVLALSPDFTESRFNLAITLFNMGRKAEAIEMMESVEPAFSPQRDKLLEAFRTQTPPSRE